MMRMPAETVEHLRHVLRQPGTERYEILDRAGEGGMGVVYRAFDRELRREVALKVLRAPQPSAAESARMLREANVLAALEHPGIVPVHDVGTLPDGRVFYVMKLVRGLPLDRFALAGRSHADLIALFRRICEAIAFAHARGIIHRDLKPQNVMVGDFGEVLVVDWGIAKVGAAREKMESAGATLLAPTDTAPGATLGTPGYMAPEQSGSHDGAIDERADVFGLGGVLQFLLTGVHPTDPRADSAWTSVPRPLRAICDRARATDRVARYESAAALSLDLAAFIDGRPVSAYRENPAERAARLFNRHRPAVFLIVGYLLLRAAMLIFARDQ